MKLNTAQTALLDTNVEGSLEFQITANATAFQILSSGLYSDKVRAVIRELCCNAYDAHIAAGKAQVPIKVTLPTSMHSVFTVSDEGTGLTHDQVVSLYTNYFSSDKRQSNSFTGGFGLGSKSPFAYTDNFSVVARHDGVERVYLCHLNENGVPSLTKVSETVVGHKKPNGVDVSFSVKPSDIDQFQEKAVLVLQWFDVQPVLVNATKEWPVKDYVIDESHYAIPGHEHTANQLGQYSAHMALVKMGNVTYPLDWTRLMGDDVFCQKLVTEGAIELRLPIGAAAIAASREELQYDPKTCANIKRALRTALHDMCQTLIQKTNAAAGRTWAGGVVANQLKTRLSSMRQLLPAMLEGSNHQHKEVATYLFQHDAWDAPTIGLGDGVTVQWLRPGTVGKKVLKRGMYSTGRYAYHAQLQLVDKSAVIIGDADNVDTRLRVARETHTLEQALVFVAPKDRRALMLQHATACAKALGDMPIIYASALPVTAPNVTTAVRAKSTFVPVDDRVVTYFDLTDGECYEMPLRDVPEEGRFYATKMTTGSSAGSYDVGGNKLWYSTDEDHFIGKLTKFSKATVPLFQQLPDWSAPHGLLLVKPIDIERLGLADRDFSTWGTAMSEALQTPELQKVLHGLAAAYDFIGHFPKSNYYSKPWYVLFCHMVTAAKNPSVLWDVFQRAGLDTHVRGYLQATEASAALRDAVNQMQWDLTSCGFTVGPAMRNIQQMEVDLHKAYPLLEVLNREKLMESVKGNTRGVACVLAGALGVSTPA